MPTPPGETWFEAVVPPSPGATPGVIPAEDLLASRRRNLFNPIPHTGETEDIVAARTEAAWQRSVAVLAEQLVAQAVPLAQPVVPGKAEVGDLEDQHQPEQESAADRELPDEPDSAIEPENEADADSTTESGDAL